jgi:hypothetical protein
MTDIMRTIFSRRTEIQPDVPFLGRKRLKFPCCATAPGATPTMAIALVKKLPTSYQLKPGLD